MSRVADLLSELVAIPTHQAGPDGTSGNERRLCDHLAPLLRERGADEVIVADAKRTDGSPGAYIFARWGTPRRIINAHVDTVPANAGWSRDPWKPHVAGDERDIDLLLAQGDVDVVIDVDRDGVVAAVA